MLQVEIDIFSGMPNPTFELTEKEEKMLELKKSKIVPKKRNSKVEFHWNLIFIKKRNRPFSS